MKIGIGIKMKNIISGKTFEEAEQALYELQTALMKKRKKYITQRDTAIKMLTDIDLDLEQIRRYATSLKSVVSKQAQPANTSSAS